MPKTFVIGGTYINMPDTHTHRYNQFNNYIEMPETAVIGLNEMNT